jgi:beta-N-acetylhexosaminidase
MPDTFIDLPLEQKIGKLFFIGLPGPVIDEQASFLLDKIRPGGLCLFARNIREAAQTRELSDAIIDRLGGETFISLDQEGGLVDRLRRVVTPMPAASQLRDVEAAAVLGTIIAETVRILGFNMDFAPVVDVITDERQNANNGMFSRAFGRTGDEAATLAGAFLNKLQSGGCMGCLKHFPGLGSAAVDSHEELPSVPLARDELFNVDLSPYRKLFSEKIVNAVMAAHAAYPNTGLQETTSDGKLLPSSLSPAVVSGLLRTELQFDGLVITDDLEMGAIIKNFGIGEACVLALEADVDMLAICADPDRIVRGYEAVSDAVRSGRISEDRVDRSLQRIARAGSLLHRPLPFDTERLDELSRSVERLNAQLN